MTDGRCQLAAVLSVDIGVMSSCSGVMSVYIRVMSVDIGVMPTCSGVMSVFQGDVS